ncbi:type I restriction enzyme M protein [Burkholderia ambifaria]|nr:N-6 DNA methylase [Burkholderia ambifaria]MDR6499128.1 type I restriction enzyme M protein [Burkholderia ambifaria]
MLQINATLKSLIDRLWNRFWSGGISNPIAAIEQISYLLFMKQIDELDRRQEFEAKHNGGVFHSRFAGKYKAPNTSTPIEKSTLRWSYLKEMEAEDLLPHMVNYAFPFIKTLESENNNFARHMANAVFLIPNENLLKGAVVIIEEIFTEIDRDAREDGHLFQDIQGDVYEMLLNEISSSGKNGQFRTPRHIIKLVSELVDPQLGQRICDPACGTAGFLLDAYHYIGTKIVLAEKNKKQVDADDDGFIRVSAGAIFTQNTKRKLESDLYGYDFDATMVRLALMNLMMHGIDNPRIDYADTLSKNFHETEAYDVVMANPPFTGSIDKGDINSILRSNTSKTEILFTERILTLLKPGGVAGIVIPRGVLFSSANAFVEMRKRLLEETNLQAVISLPSGVFRPYAGVATAILIFERKGKTKSTWFYDVENDGFSLDDKRQRIPGSELQDVVRQWRLRDPKANTDRKGKHFFVSAKEIRDAKYDLSFGHYRKSEQAEVVYEHPDTVLNRLRDLELRIQTDIDELTEILK